MTEGRLFHNVVTSVGKRSCASKLLANFRIMREPAFQNAYRSNMCVLTNVSLEHTEDADALNTMESHERKILNIMRTLTCYQ